MSESLFEVGEMVWWECPRFMKTDPSGWYFIQRIAATKIVINEKKGGDGKEYQVSPEELQSY